MKHEQTVHSVERVLNFSSSTVITFYLSYFQWSLTISKLLLNWSVGVNQKPLWQKKKLETHLAWVCTIGGFKEVTLERSPVHFETTIRDSDIQEVTCKIYLSLLFMQVS